MCIDVLHINPPQIFKNIFAFTLLLTTLFYLIFGLFILQYVSELLHFYIKLSEFNHKL